MIEFDAVSDELAEAVRQFIWQFIENELEFDDLNMRVDWQENIEK
jgi:hypothetical protein